MHDVPRDPVKGSHMRPPEPVWLCLLCGSGQSTLRLIGVPPLGSATPSRFGIACCARCGLIETRPRPSPEELRPAYGSAYTWTPGTVGFLGAAEALYRKALVRCDQVRVVRRAARLANGTRLLDLGCGDGLLVAEARRLGLVAYGIDRPDAPLWPECDPDWRKAGNVETIDQPAASWDLVSLFHVLEHLGDPLAVLRKVRAWLRDGGLLIVQVPNAGSLQAQLFGARWYGFDVPRHLVHWTEGTLTRALCQTGYDVVTTCHVSLRDNGPFLAGSFLPTLDPLIERERALVRGRPRSTLVLAVRRLIFFCAVWGCTPLALFEALARRGATITILARKAA